MFCYLYAANISKITLRVKSYRRLFFVIKCFLTHFTIHDTKNLCADFFKIMLKGCGYSDKSVIFAVG